MSIHREVETKKTIEFKSNVLLSQIPGNIILHIFSQQSRKIYDLETLWSVGSEYDDQSNVPVDELTELFKKHSYLAGLQPAEISN